MNELVAQSATEVVALLRRGEIAPREAVAAAVERIEAVDSSVNALPIRCFDRALAQAEGAFDRDDPRSLCGLPIAVKDYNDVGGVRTTYGSPIFANHVPVRSDATVARLEEHGAIPVAKSNVPEWAGGHTFNPVLGLTRNPWDRSLSAGGSSGGSAAALATGQVWLATGNDLGGSLRTPASFNGVVGLRPSPGRVPRGQRLSAFDTLWVEGPMGRCVSDVALMLDAGAGRHPDDPLSFDAAPVSEVIHQDQVPRRMAFSSNLNIVPMHREIAAVCEQSASQFAGLGVDISDDIPDFAGAVGCFQTLRAVLVATMMGDMLEAHRARIAPEIVDNIERGFAVTPHDLFDAERVRWALSKQMTDFFKHHDLLICPATSISPFPVETRYVEEIDGQKCETYIDWFAITFALTLTSCPVISIPCGVTADGLPVGMQLVGPPRGEATLLRAARQLESIVQFTPRLPITPDFGT
ncbi:MAG: amidase family protein [Pseudomonadota bacterium]